MKADSATKAPHANEPQPPVIDDGEVRAVGIVCNKNGFPLIIQPARGDISLVNWSQINRQLLEQTVDYFGGLLFRGFGIDSAEVLEEIASVLTSELITENGEHVPASPTNRIQTPVPYSSQKKLLWHNENTFNSSWPTRIFFACAIPARSGGETPLVDSRRLFSALPLEVKSPFIEKGIMYVRNYSEVLGLSWQKVFGTDNRVEAEGKAKLEGMRFEWNQDGSLKTTCVRPATYQHPRTNEWCWCNQAQHWHPSCLDEITRAYLLERMGEAQLPRNCYYGDGTAIPAEIMNTILDVLQEMEVCFPWQKGDLLMIDNLMVAHGRNPYAGKRKIFVALGDPIEV